MNKLEQAARALLAHWDTPALKYLKPTGDLMADLRKALAEQAEQEPVAWVDPTEEQIMAQTGYVDMNHDDLIDFYLVVELCKQLNSAPVRTKDLTRDEVEALFWKWKSATEYPVPLFEFRDIARAVIAADREKNK